MTKREAATLIGDRENPLEADPAVDVVRDAPEIGQRVEVSPVAGGDTFDQRGAVGKVTGVFYRFGEVVGYEAEIKGKLFTGSRKDFYIGMNNVLEGVQPPTATSAAVKGSLVHWGEARTYWRPLIDGLENFCFELAGVTKKVVLKVFARDEGGMWRFFIEEPMGTSTVVDCRISFHDNYWTLLTAVYPCREPVPTPDADHVELGSEDHWTRTYLWTGAIAKHFPVWADALENLRLRVNVTRKILIPTFLRTLPKVISAHEKEIGPLSNPTEISVGLSTIRLRPGTVAMTEPATDRKPYTTITLSPEVVTPKNDLFRQTVLHELIHYAVASRGGEAHNDDFIKLSEVLGLRPEYRD